MKSPEPRRHRRQTRPTGWLRLAVTATLALGAASGQAATRSLTGELLRDDQLAVFRFEVGSTDFLSVSSFAYGGGTNAAGQDIAAGGFAPVLALFEDGAGLLQLVHGASSSCGPAAGRPDPASGFCWDTSFSMALASGHYTLVLSQDGNEPRGSSLAEGYSQDGRPDYTGLLYLGEAGRSFVQVDGSQRQGRWALDIQASAVPEPAGALLMLAGLVGIALQARKNRQMEPIA